MHQESSTIERRTETTTVRQETMHDEEVYIQGIYTATYVRATRQHYLQIIGVLLDVDGLHSEDNVVLGLEAG